MQGIHTGATVGVGVVVGVGSRGGVGLAVAVRPGEAFAGSLGHGVVCAVVDGQVQGDCRVCTVDVLILARVVAGCRIYDAVPLVRFAGGDCKFIRGGVEHRQMQSVNLRTAVVVEMTVLIVAARGVGQSVAVCPSVGVVSSDGVSLMLRLVDGEVQGDCRVCTVDVLILTRVVAGCRIYDAVPLVGFAGGDCKFIRRGVEHRQMQSVNLRAAVAVEVAVLIVAARGVGLSVTVRPSVGVVSSDGVSLMLRLVDGQMQGHKRVCTVDVLILTRVVAGCRVHDAVPLVGFAGGDCKFI